MGSTNCPYCPEADAKLLSYFNPSHVDFVGSDITSKWFLINYHTYSPGRGDPMYEFLRGTSETEKMITVTFVLKKATGIRSMVFLPPIQMVIIAQ